MRTETSRMASWMPVWTLTLLAALTLSFPAAAADPLAVTVFTDKASYVRGEQATLTMEVKNTSALAVAVSFNNSQQHDFSVRDANGTLLWNSSYGQTPTSGSTTRVMAPGEVLRYQATWAFIDNAGSAVFDGILTVTGTFYGQYVGRSGTKAASQNLELITLDPLEVTFSTDKTSYSKLATPANLTLKVTNIGTYPVTIDFANGQSYEFSARNASGSTVWTWSNGKTFDPNPVQVVLAPGEFFSFTAAWSFKNNSGSTVADGNYTLGGTFLGQYYGAIPPKGGEATVRVYTLF
jgi:hypothetical protein